MDKDAVNLPLEHLLISDVNDINFKNILYDYATTFAGHRVQLITNYNLLSKVDIVFSMNDLPHLMGWNKVRTKNKNASQIIEDVESEEWTVQVAKKNSQWFKVRKRMLNYNILHRIFIDKDIVPMVLTSDMKPNRLKLDIVFVINETKESIILGFRKAKGRTFFVPTTLHTESLDNQYNIRRRTEVKNIYWID